MATSQILSNSVNTIANTVQTLFTAGTSPVVIDSFTAVNNSTVTASYKAYIVSSNGIQKALRPFKVVVWGELDLGIGIVNQIIPAGADFKLEASAIDSIYFTATGSTR